MLYHCIRNTVGILVALFPNALRWRASINLLIFPKKCMFQTSLVLYCSGNENLESSASVILPAENGQTIRESGSPVFLLRGALPTVVLVYQLGGGQWWDLTQHCRSHGGLRAWPASLLGTATCLIIPKDICKCEKQICTVPCWRQHWDAYPICDNSLPLTDIPRESFRETKSNRKQKLVLSSRREPGFWSSLHKLH